MSAPENPAVVQAVANHDPATVVVGALGSPGNCQSMPEAPDWALKRETAETRNGNPDTGNCNTGAWSGCRRLPFQCRGLYCRKRPETRSHCTDRRLARRKIKQ